MDIGSSCIVESSAEANKSLAGLTIRGEIPFPLVAIVGTRSPSSFAEEAAFTVAKLLAQSGIGAVSGLAHGIDAAGHRGCLAGGGRTVAVLGHGLDAPIYPPDHQDLAETIACAGALVSPFTRDSGLSKRRLVWRNRWIARLACAVWVVQTTVPGGALAAAAHAKRLEIPVLTTPWDEPKWRQGYDVLLKRGAETADVLTIVPRLIQLCREHRQSRQGELML
jgi:DNA processing protein